MASASLRGDAASDVEQGLVGAVDGRCAPFFGFFYEPSTNGYLPYLFFCRLFLHGLWDFS